MPIDPILERWTLRAEPAGWLRVGLEPTCTDEFLCRFTRVIVTGEKAGRTYFNITEGNRSVGQAASVSTANADRYLGHRRPGGSATLTVKYVGTPVSVLASVRGDTLVQQWADLTFTGTTVRVTLNILWNQQYIPIAPSVHAILAPDGSHANISTTIYVKATPGMIGNDIWFPIGLNGTLQNSSSYIHVGQLSEGCVTVYELQKWSALYQYLISHRVAGSLGRRIGRLIVQK